MEQIEVKKRLEERETGFLFKQLKRVLQVFLILGSKNKLGGHHVI